MKLYFVLVSASADTADDNDVSISIQRCTLNVHWTPEKNEVDECRVSLYRMRLFRNSTEISTADTTALKYSYNGIHSDSTYRVEVRPILRCDNGSTLLLEIKENNISAIPGIK
jgi:hypothetical protein